MSVLVSSTLPEHSLSTLALERGLHGVTRAEILKYCAFVALGMSRDEARQMILPKRAPSSLSRVGSTSVRLDEDVYERLREKYPDMTNSQLLRYITAIETGRNHNQAIDFAIVPMGRPPKKKDTKDDGGNPARDTSG